MPTLVVRLALWHLGWGGCGVFAEEAFFVLSISVQAECGLPTLGPATFIFFDDLKPRTYSALIATGPVEHDQVKWGP